MSKVHTEFATLWSDCSVCLGLFGKDVMEAYRLVSFTSTNTGQLQPLALATACAFILT